MSASSFATVGPIQKLVTDSALAAGAPNLASAVSIGRCNLGNAVGAWAGGTVIALGFGLAVPNWTNAILSVGALVLAVMSGWLGRSDDRTRLVSVLHGLFGDRQVWLVCRHALIDPAAPLGLSEEHSYARGVGMALARLIVDPTLLNDRW